MCDKRDQNVFKSQQNVLTGVRKFYYIVLYYIVQNQENFSLMRSEQSEPYFEWAYSNQKTPTRTTKFLSYDPQSSLTN